MPDHDPGGGAEMSELPRGLECVPCADDLGLTSDDAECLKAQAAVYRAVAVAAGSPMFKAENLAKAFAMEAMAGQVGQGLAPVKRGAGGEVMITVPLDAPWKDQEVAQATTNHAAMTTAEASVARLQLARDVDCLALAVDVAERHGATSPTEQILAHQVAAGHQLAMKLLAKSRSFLGREFLSYKDPFGTGTEAQREQMASIEAGRLATSAARMMEATARAAMALDRLRNGSTQTIVVQQKVEVQSGGQAVVAGAVDVGRSRKKRAR